MTTRPAEAFWQRAHGKEWIANYATSSFSASRAAMGAALRSVAPFGTVLDLGCNCGVLVPWLQVASPGARITGVDVNDEALRDAEIGWPVHTWVSQSVVDYVPQAADYGFQWDVVTSSSCLEHVAPQDITQVLAAMAQVARDAIVLQEVTVAPRMPLEGQSPLSIPEWRYDYATRLRPLGWKCTSWVEQGEPTRPGAVMTFART